MIENESLKQSNTSYANYKKWAAKNINHLQEYRKNYQADPKNKARRRENYRKNPEYYKARDKAHYERTKDRHRELQMSKKYLISVEYYRNLLGRGVCDICGLPETAQGKVLAIDHCHETKKVRGILCGNCNKALGQIKDNIQILENMKNYLLKNVKSY